jgi:hypothetical protein
MQNERKQNLSRQSKKAKDLGTYIVAGFIVGMLIGVVSR